MRGDGGITPVAGDGPLSGQFGDCAVSLLDRRLEHGVGACVGVRDRDATETPAGACVGVTLVIVIVIDGVKERVVPVRVGPSRGLILSSAPI